MSTRNRLPTLPQDAPAAVVIGGGIAGLTAARELMLEGFRVTVLEASGGFGGCVRTHEVAGLTLDAGAESFSTRSNAVPELLSELGLRDAVVYPTATGAWLELPGPDGTATAQRMPSTGILGIPANPRDPDIIKAIGNAAAVRAALDKVLPLGPLLKRERVSLADVVRERMGDQVLARLVTPIAAGVFSSDPAALDVDVVAPGLRAAMARHGSLGAAVGAMRAAAPAGSAVAGIRGGMGTMTTALVQSLTDGGARLLTDTPARAIRHARTRTGPQWSVFTDNGGFAADALVVATDGPTATKLLTETVPELAGDSPTAGPSVALVTLVLDLPELDVHPRGTGVLVAPGISSTGGRGVAAKALTHATAKWQWLAEAAGPGGHVLRLSYGRATVLGAKPDITPRVETGTDQELYEQALSDASALLDVSMTAQDVVGWDVVRWVGALPSAAVGHRDRVARIRVAVSNQPGLEVVGAWLSGTGLVAVITDARTRMARLAKRD